MKLRVNGGALRQATRARSQKLGLITVIAALSFLAALATGCATAEPSEPEDSQSKHQVPAQVFAEDFNTTIDKVRCEDFGTVTQNFEGRPVSYCHLIGGRDWETGCYDTETGQDYTVGLRIIRGSQEIC